MNIKRECEYTECPVEAALDMIGGKWKSMIVAILMDEQSVRFNELQRRLKDVTHKVLTKQLRDLEKCGLVNRAVHAEVPPRVEYSLTDLGRTLEPLMAQLRQWGEKFALKRTTEKQACEVADPNEC